MKYEMIMSEEIKYEAVFGDQCLFDSLVVPDHVEVLRFNDYSKEYLWGDLNTVKLSTSNELKAIPIVAMRRIIKAPVQHSDDIAVDLFAAKMKEKLEKSRDKGRSGWETCPVEYLIASLKDHISKGDPVDVANFAMMISQRGESIKTPVWTVADQKAGRLPEVGVSVVGVTSHNEKFVVYVDDDVVVVKHKQDKDVVVAFNHSSFLTAHNPIETPAEKAQREEDEFVDSLIEKGLVYTSFYIEGIRAAYRKLKGGE